MRSLCDKNNRQQRRIQREENSQNLQKLRTLRNGLTLTPCTHPAHFRPKFRTSFASGSHIRPIFFRFCLDTFAISEGVTNKRVSQCEGWDEQIRLQVSDGQNNNKRHSIYKRRVRTRVTIQCKQPWCCVDGVCWCAELCWWLDDCDGDWVDDIVLINFKERWCVDASDVSVLRCIDALTSCVDVTSWWL
jgi:hypothetical protein